MKKEVVDIKTGETYQSISEAAKRFQINPKTLALYLSGKLKNKTNFQYAE